MKKILIITAAVSLVTVLSAIYLTSCGGGSGSASTGTLQVSMTDSFSDYSSVFIRIKEVKVVRNGDENATNNNPGLPVIADFSGEEGGGREIDVVKLHFLQEILGTAVVPAGTYTQVRLILVDNPASGDPVNYIVKNGIHPLSTPSGQESGVKVLGRFVVEEGVINAIMIDFDPATAVVKDGSSGNYNLKPTGIRIVQLEDVLSSYGSLSGRVAAFQRWSSAVVSVQEPGGTAPVAAGTVFSNNSSSALWSSKFSAFAPAGSYEVHVTDVTPLNTFRDYTSHTAFPVVIGSDTDVGTITLTSAP